MKRLPNHLSAGEHNSVVTISPTQVAKVFTPRSRTESGSEFERLRFANAVNGLVVKAGTLDYNEDSEDIWLVMERLYPMDYRAYTNQQRKQWLQMFKQQLDELHQAGFVHRHIVRSNMFIGQPFDNVILTSTGLRLIDVAAATLRKQVTDAIFNRCLVKEWKSVEAFEQFFLTR